MLASHAVRLSASASSLRPGVLLTQDQANQSGALSRFPWLKPLFQLGVSVDSFRDFSEQAAPVTAKQGRGLVTAHGSFEALCPGRGEARRAAACSFEAEEGSSEVLLEALAASSEAVVDPSTCELHPDAQAAGGPERCPQHEVPEVVYCCCRDCTSCTRPVILNWPQRIKTQPHDDRDNCFLHFESNGPCGMTVNNDIDDDSATKHINSHTRNSHRQSV